MAKRGGEAMAKRARERARQAKQQAKQERRQAAVDEPGLPAGREAVLMEEFAQLSARFESKTISLDDFTAERDRIFEELGIEAG